MTFLFLVCTFAGWLIGSLMGFVACGTLLRGVSLYACLGLSLGAALAVLLERRGQSTTSDDSVLANFGLVWVGCWVGWLSLLCLQESLSLEDMAGEGCLMLPVLGAFSAAWLAKRPKVSALLPFGVTMLLWTGLTGAEAAALALYRGHSLDFLAPVGGLAVTMFTLGPVGLKLLPALTTR